MIFLLYSYIYQKKKKKGILFCLQSPVKIWEKYRMETMTNLRGKNKNKKTLLKENYNKYRLKEAKHIMQISLKRKYIKAEIKK